MRGFLPWTNRKVYCSGLCSVVWRRERERVSEGGGLGESVAVDVVWWSLRKLGELIKLDVIGWWCGVWKEREVC
jgi:hypothetical protein